MRKISTSPLLLTLVLAAYGTAVSAAPANPLVRPAALGAKSSAPGGRQLSMPPAPPSPVPAYGAEPVGAGDVGAGKSAGAVRSLLGRYAVVAIAGDMAVLRLVPGTVGGADAAGTANPSGMSQPMMQPMPATGAVAASTVTAQSAQLLPSLLVKNKQPLTIQDVEVIPEIASGQVWLRAGDASRVLFYGRLEGMSVATPKGVKLEVADPAYVSRHSPPVGASGAAQPSAQAPGASPSGGGMPYGGMPRVGF